MSGRPSKPVCHTFFPVARGGSIMLTSSVGGLKAYPHTGHYIAAKHGVIGLMRTFAVELGEHFIRVNSVRPTNVNTPMFMNKGPMKLFRPDLEHPGPEDLEVAASSCTCCRSAGSNPSISAAPCCSWPPTKRDKSRALLCPSMPAAC